MRPTNIGFVCGLSYESKERRRCARVWMEKGGVQECGGRRETEETDQTEEKEEIRGTEEKEEIKGTKETERTGTIDKIEEIAKCMLRLHKKR